MTSSKSIFFDEWRNCLQEHYLYVLRHGDWPTEKTLYSVLLDVGGFTEEEIQEMRVYILGEAAYPQEEFMEESVVEEVEEEISVVEIEEIVEETLQEEAIFYEETEMLEEESPPEIDSPSTIQQGRLF